MPRAASSASSAAAAAATSGSSPTATMHAANGASAAGQTMPSASWCCVDAGGDERRRSTGARRRPRPRRRRVRCAARYDPPAQRAQPSPATARRRSPMRAVGHVASEVEAARVMIGAIGAGDRAGDRGDLGVGEHGHAPAVRAGEADLGAGHLAHHRVGRQPQRSEAGERAQLAVGDRAIAAHQRHQRLIVVADVDDRLDQGGRRRAEERGDVGDRLSARASRPRRAARSPPPAPPARAARPPRRWRRTRTRRTRARLSSPSPGTTYARARPPRLDRARRHRRARDDACDCVADGHRAGARDHELVARSRTAPAAAAWASAPRARAAAGSAAAMPRASAAPTSPSSWRAIASTRARTRAPSGNSASRRPKPPRCNSPSATPRAAGGDSLSVGISRRELRIGLDLYMMDA